MIGDTLSDTHVKLVEDMSHYREEVAHLPVEIRGQLHRLIADVEAARLRVDQYQAAAQLS